MDVHVRAYYASWDPDSLTRCTELRDELVDYAVEILEVGASRDAWRRTGMRTVPAVEILINGRTVRLMAGSISTALIRASLAEVRGEVVSPLWRIEPLEVVGTTGSHRYDRWGEYFLTHYSSPDFGWSSPSCCEATPARLVFDAMRPYQFRRVGLTPRDWMLDSELRKSFPRRFDVKVSGDGDSWTTALAVDEYECDAPGIQYWPLDAVGRYISLEVREVGLRAELKFFSQVMKFEVWGDPPAPASPLGMARGLSLIHI